jgi:hypothetical protein
MHNFLFTPDAYGGNQYDFSIENHNTGIRVSKNINIPKYCDNKLIFNNQNILEEFCRLYNIPLPTFPPIAHKKTLKQLNYNPNHSNVEWWKIMGFKNYINYLQNIASNFESEINQYDLTYWFQMYQHYIDNLFNEMQPIKIDIVKYKQYRSEANLSQLEVLESFNPINGYARKAIYSGTETKTGRLKVIDGSNILHLKREYRDMLVSSHGDKGRIYYLDYSSLEPRILLHVSKSLYSGSVPQDIYFKMLVDLNLLEKIPRSVAKTAILAILYGQSENNTIKLLSNYIGSPEDFIYLVNEYFGIEELKQRLVENLLKADGRYILNHYGRPIFCEDTKPYALLNYYVQSTAVDVAMMGFMNIINRLKEYQLTDMIKPVFILHDALILDIHEDAYHIVPKIEKLGSKNIKKFENVDFYLRSE